MVHGALSAAEPNETKMSDGGRDRALLGVRMWKSSQKWSVRRSAVRSIAWLDRQYASNTGVMIRPTSLFRVIQ